MFGGKGKYGKQTEPTETKNKNKKWMREGDIDKINQGDGRKPVRSEEDLKRMRI